MKKLIGLLAIAVMATSCVDLTGSLDVKETLNAKKRGGFLNLQRKDVKIEPGIYSASLKVNSKSSFTLKLKSKVEDESDILIPIKSTEEEFNIPTNGEVSIKGKTVEQPFDLKGDISTTYSSSDIYKTDESCTYTVPERRCEKVCRDMPAPSKENPKRTVPRCDVECRTVQVSYPGMQYVEYHYAYTTRSLKASILAEGSDKVLATFSGTDTESDKRYDLVGVCR